MLNQQKVYKGFYLNSFNLRKEVEMSNEKIVVVLLIVTIVLSVFSAILTLGFGHGSNNDAPYLQRSVTDHPESSGQIVFGVEPNPNTSGGGP